MLASAIKVSSTTFSFVPLVLVVAVFLELVSFACVASISPPHYRKAY